jgi:exodeoxyribonuclease V gamma subunit
MCTMVPMRSVPHRVVCVLGLDDGVFPRAMGTDGDDVLARTPRVGDRDPRSEDRQLLLDAVMAATDHLVLLYAGADERTNAHRPPAVPLGELLDTIDGTARSFTGGRGRDQVLVRHPLQPFAPSNFTPGALGVPGPFSHDRTELAAAVAATGAQQDEPPFLSHALPAPTGDGTVPLDDLIRFLSHPVRAFLRQRLSLTLFLDDDDPAEELPVELNALEKWGIGNRLLRDRLRGVDQHRCVQAEWRRGLVPPGALGTRLLTELTGEVEPLVAAAGQFLTPDPQAHDVLVPLPGGRRITGTVSGVHGDTILSVDYSNLGPKHRLRAWINLLALTAGRTDRPWRAVAIGRGKQGPAHAILGPLDPALVPAQLASLVALLDEGLCRPLPMVLKTSHAYAVARAAGRSEDAALKAAGREWTRSRGGGESEEAAHVLVWGADAPLEVLLATPAAGAHASEASRFAELAMRLWAPLSAAETASRP